ncbi:hypothetical protein Plec18167_003400 [Paecilomyces lecythidis]|uniref:SnoaL-like domain-containing protein n=1 Tax=Paecilomyces lecythidis TaxID=3004212 RepID=A0ABR3XYW9_9EURO
MAESDLKVTVEALQRQVQILSAESEVRKLHHKYGYYIDKCLYQEVVDLFANHPETSVQFLGGRFLGKAGAKRLYIDRFQKHFVGGRNGPVEGFLLDHLLAQDIVDIDTSGPYWIAKMRLRTLMSAGTHESLGDKVTQRQWWEGGIYENEYILEDGIWKIFHLRYFPFWHGEFDKGWQKTRPNYVPFFSKTYPEDPAGPDELTPNNMMWPDTRVVPFHYPHPVTGVPVQPLSLRAPKLGEDAESATPEIDII